jgi:hypothetical protein
MRKWSKVELYEQIRKAHERDELSIRALAEHFEVHRRTVREALASPIPPPRKKAERSAPTLGPWKSTIDGWLADDVEVPKKQRHTARRIWQRLVDEHDAVISESTVRHYVATAKGRRPITAAEVMIPQTHPLGSESEVDFGSVSFYLCGELTAAWMYVMRLSASGKGYHRVYANQAQEAFVDGHVRALEVVAAQSQAPGGLRRVRVSAGCGDHRHLGHGRLLGQGRTRGAARRLGNGQEPLAHRHGHGRLRAGQGSALCHLCGPGE